MKLVTALLMTFVLLPAFVLWMRSLWLDMERTKRQTLEARNRDLGYPPGTPWDEHPGSRS